MNDLDEKEKNKYKILRIVIASIILSILIGFAIYLTIILYPIAIRLNDDIEYRNEIISYLDSNKHYSFLIILGAQIIQTILAVIPAGPIVIISGLLFNVPTAVLVCIIGQTLGSVIVYLLVKLLGVKFVALFFDPEKIKNSRILKNEERTKVLLFGYLLIPALPKDILAFIVPFTKVNVLDFGIISLIARIPMTICTVLIGTSISTGNYYLGIISGAISAILALLCFIFNKKIISFLEKFKFRKEKNK